MRKQIGPIWTFPCIIIIMVIAALMIGVLICLVLHPLQLPATAETIYSLSMTMRLFADFRSCLACLGHSNDGVSGFMLRSCHDWNRSGKFLVLTLQKALALPPIFIPTLHASSWYPS